MNTQPAPHSPNITVCTPSHKGYCDEYLDSVIRLQRLAIEKRVQLDIKRIVGHSSLPMARTMMMRDFLDTTSTHLVFIDSDQGFVAHEVFELIDLDVPIVGAVCCQKRYDWESIHRAARLMDADTASKLPIAGSVFTFDTGEAGFTIDTSVRKPVPVRRVGFGFTVIQRKVIQTLAMRATPKVNLPGGRPFPAICAQRIVPIEGKPAEWEWLTEDYAFCSRAKDVGYQSYIAWWAKTTHTGDHTFGADLVAAGDMLGGVSQVQT